VTIAFGGDVHFMGSSGLRLATDPNTAVGPMAAVLRGADLAIVNLETAITTRGTPAVKSFHFRAPPSAFTALRSAGIDLVTQANNHGMDFGLVGLQDSLDAAGAANLPVVGIGRDDKEAFTPYRVTIRDQRIAVLGATDVLDTNLIGSWTAGPGKPGLASAKDPARLVAAVQAARSSSDTVVVYLHYGAELQSCPTDRQRTLVRQLVDAGADIIVGSHAHVLLRRRLPGRRVRRLRPRQLRLLRRAAGTDPRDRRSHADHARPSRDRFALGPGHDRGRRGAPAHRQRGGGRRTPLAGAAGLHRARYGTLRNGPLPPTGGTRVKDMVL